MISPKWYDQIDPLRLDIEPSFRTTIICKRIPCINQFRSFIKALCPQKKYFL